MLGHPRDPVHPFSDAGHARLEMPERADLEANSLVELRLTPDRLTGEIADFLDELWAPARRGRAQHPLARENPLESLVAGPERRAPARRNAHAESSGEARQSPPVTPECRPRRRHRSPERLRRFAGRDAPRR